MDIMITKDITEVFNEVSYRTVEATCGKTSATLVVTPVAIHVCVNNANHRAWRGLGKTFETFDQALENYKSSAMKQIIAHVKRGI